MHADSTRTRGFALPSHCAHYDVAVAACSASPPADAGDPVQLLDAGLRAVNLRTGAMAFDAPGNSTPLGAAAAKFLCIDDGVFERTDGAEFAARSVRAAHKAGRMVGLLCVEPARVYRNRNEILAGIASQLDYVIGEPPAVLALFGVRRIDTLVPHMLRSGIGLIMHRVARAPVFLRYGRREIEPAGETLSRTAFWSDFVPASIGRLLCCETGADVAQSSRAAPCPALQRQAR